MKRILIAYHSQEKGNTQQVAELVASGVAQVPGMKVDVVNLNAKGRINVGQFERADAYAFGSPEYFVYMAGTLKQCFDDLCLALWDGRRIGGKPYVAFLTHSGGGKGIASIEKIAKLLKLEKAAPSVVCEGAPEGDAVDQSIELGRKLAETVADKA